MEKKLYLCTAIVLAIALCLIPIAALTSEADDTLKLTDFAAEQNADLAAVYSKAKDISESGKNVVLDNNEYTNSFFRCSYQSYAESEKNFVIGDDGITMNLSSGKADENDVYGIFLGLLTECYTDYAAYNDYVAAEHSTKLNRPAATYLVFCNDYKALGYNSIDDYLTAVKNGECEYTENTYRIDFQGKNIAKMTDETNTNIYPEIAG